MPLPPRRLNGKVRPSPVSGRPEARRWAAVLVQGVVEAITGDRPVSQLVRWTTLDVYEQLQWECRRRARRPSAVREDRAKASVHSVHVFEPSPSVAEVCATVRSAGRAHALALRLETHGEAWRCTAITFG